MLSITLKLFSENKKQKNHQFFQRSNFVLTGKLRTVLSGHHTHTHKTHMPYLQHSFNICLHFVDFHSPSPIREVFATFWQHVWSWKLWSLNCYFNWKERETEAGRGGMADTATHLTKRGDTLAPTSSGPGFRAQIPTRSRIIQCRFHAVMASRIPEGSARAPVSTLQRSQLSYTLPLSEPTW